MDKDTAKTLSKKLQTSIDSVIREEYEMLILKELYESVFSNHLVFKGGTALRLAYGSPRFSEDLDFTAIGKFNIKAFLTFLQELPTHNSGIVEVTAIEKHYTVFGLAKIKDPMVSRPFSIKIEVSKRQGMKDTDYTDTVISSETTVFRVVARVMSLKRILLEKEDALKNRKAPRDLFDWWFINQSLGLEVKPNLNGYSKELVKAELRRLLPKPHWRLINIWLA